VLDQRTVKVWRVLSPQIKRQAAIPQGCSWQLAAVKARRFSSAALNPPLSYTHRPMICCRFAKMRLGARFIFPKNDFGCKFSESHQRAYKSHVGNAGHSRVTYAGEKFPAVPDWSLGHLDATQHRLGAWGGGPFSAQTPPLIESLPLPPCIGGSSGGRPPPHPGP
jgi:hypothetical protein